MPNDFDIYLQRANPFAQTVSSYAGQDMRVAPSLGSLGSAINWENQQRALQARGAVPFSQVSQSWSTPSLGSAPTANGGSSAPTVIRNPRNTQVDSTLSGLLNQVNGLNTNPSQNPNVVHQNVRNPGIATQAGSALNRFAADSQANRQSFADFTAQYMATQPQAQAQATEEGNALGAWYNGGVQNQLNSIANQRGIAVTQQAQRAGREAQARNNAGRLMAGNSSYLDAQLLDAMTGIGAEEARQRADMNRANYLTVLQGQQSNAGRRQGLMDAALNRMLTPIQANQAMAGNELAQLGALSNIDSANNFYTLTNPNNELAQKLALLSQASGIDLQNTFYGLQRPYDPDTSGYLPVNRVGVDNSYPNIPVNDLLNLNGYVPQMNMPVGQQRQVLAQQLDPAQQRINSNIYREQALRNYLYTPQGVTDYMDAYGNQLPNGLTWEDIFFDYAQ